MIRYIPRWAADIRVEDLTDDVHDLAELIGVQPALLVVEYFDGRLLSLPTLEDVLTAAWVSMRDRKS